MSETSPRAGVDLAKIFVVGIGVALTAAIVGIIVYSTRSGSGRADIRGRVSAYTVVDERKVLATLEIDKAPLASAECDVTAFDDRGSSVGRLTGVVIGPKLENQRVVLLNVEVLTPMGRATSAQVTSCRITRTR